MVLVKQNRPNKSTPYYDPEPLTITAIKGNMVTAEKESKTITRNCFFFKKWRGEVVTTQTTSKIVAHQASSTQTTRKIIALQVTVNHHTNESINENEQNLNNDSLNQNNQDEVEQTIFENSLNPELEHANELEQQESVDDGQQASDLTPKVEYNDVITSENESNDDVQVADHNLRPRKLVNYNEKRAYNKHK